MNNSTIDQKNELVAKRWAKALFELANESSGISKIDILDDLEEIANNINNSKELSEVINNPSISVYEKQIVLSKLFEYKIMPIVYNFIITLNLKRRITIIKAIAEQFRKELENYNNILKIEITSAIEIDTEKKVEIKKRIASKLNKDVSIDWNIDSNIIGGLIFNINENIINDSVKHKLENLYKKVKK